jgi:hypothetical protein
LGKRLWRWWVNAFGVGWENAFGVGWENAFGVGWGTASALVGKTPLALIKTWFDHDAAATLAY